MPDAERDTQVHDSCPQGDPYAYVVWPSGFGWCTKCVRHSPATREAETVLRKLQEEGKGAHIDGHA